MGEKEEREEERREERDKEGYEIEKRNEEE